MASVSTEAPPAPALLSPGRPGYRRLSLALFVAGIATFALLYSTQALLPAVSDGLHVSPGEASWTVAAATGALAVAVVPLSALSERFGRRSMMTASLVVAVAVGLAVPFAPNLAVLIALRAVQGAALAGLPASAMAFLAEEVEARALVSAIGLFVAGNSIGGMSGRIFTGWMSQAWGWRAALLAVGVAALACAAVFRVMVPRARNFAPRPLRLGAFGRTLGGHLSNPLLLRLYAIGALFMVVFGGVYTVIGYRLVAAPFSLPQGVVGSVFVVYLVGTFTSASSGRMVARLGRRGTLYAALATTSAGLLVTLVDSIVAVIAGLVLITAGFFAGHSVASSSVSHTVKSGRAQASALYQAAYYLGSSAGGAIGAAAFHSTGWAATVVMGLAAMVGVAALTVYGTYAARRAATAAPAPL
ncbi:MFS transporter [Streptomyces montanisoli]|uniref:MFS transporter n=1 Tax=Streptomyces montanisoli TaxID=2798581 RepID=A0A940ME66_9ACTN|nr:MFS transporter [Streptomyces montanisoli]MBP0457947.1 MFS transporter [Streptomyces montanisoli]